MRGRLIIAITAFACYGTPANLAAQNTAIAEVDRNRIVACVEAAEQGMSLLPAYRSGDNCILTETWKCARKKKPAGELPDVVLSDCAAAELRVWRQLLTESYDKAIREIEKADGDNKSSATARGSFEAAQKAWEDWMKWECQYQFLATKTGATRIYVAQACMVSLTAKRVFHYRTPALVSP